MSRYSIQYLFAAACLATAMLSSQIAWAQDATPTTISAPLTLTISGRATSGTAGLSVPADLPIVLQIAHKDEKTGQPVEAYKQQVPLSADGAFSFANVVAYPGDIAIISTTFEGIPQASTPIQLEKAQTQLTLPLTLYGVTNDVSLVSLIRVQHILDFAGDAMQVLATYDFRNNSDKAYVSTTKSTSGLPISVSVPLPVGAQGIAFNAQSSQRFLLSGDINAPVVQDTKPLVPGQVQQVVFSYQLPYASGTPIDQDYPYGATVIEVLIPNDKNTTLSKVRVDGVELSGNDMTVTQNGEINAKRPYTQYTIQKALKPGDRLIYMLGNDKAPTTVPTKAVAQPTRTSSFPIEVLAFGGLLVLIVGVGLLVARSATQRGK